MPIFEVEKAMPSLPIEKIKRLGKLLSHCLPKNLTSRVHSIYTDTAMCSDYPTDPAFVEGANQYPLPH
jgi:hypothetical protein